MKKYVIGALASAVLLAGVAVSAAEVKNAIIGKKVSGVMSVSVDGKELSKEAVIIDGVSYLPVRDAAEALGGEVKGVADRRITIESKGGATVAEELAERARLEQERFAEEAKEANAKADVVTSIRNAIAGNKVLLDTLAKRVAVKELFIEKNADDPNWSGGTETLKNSPGFTTLMAEITADKAEIARLEAEIAKLESHLAELNEE